MPDEQPKEVLTVPQAADYLQASERTVRGLLAAGKLPGRKVGRSWRLSRRALDEYLSRANAVPPAPDAGEKAGMAPAFP